MSQETVETMTKAWMERVWNQQDNAAFDELMSDEFVSHGFRAAGKAEWRSFHTALRAAYSDIHITVEAKSSAETQWLHGGVGPWCIDPPALPSPSPA